MSSKFLLPHRDVDIDVTAYERGDRCSSLGRELLRRLLLSVMTHDGRTIRMHTMIDEYTRECLGIRVARRLGSYEVIEALADVTLW